MGRSLRGTLLDENNMKTCSKCLTKKSGEMFSNVKTKKDGKDPHCKDCKKKQRKDRLERDPNYERNRYKSYGKMVGEDGLTYPQRYYLRNREKILSASKEYQKKNGKKFRKKYKVKRQAYDVMRENKKNKRTPEWLTEDQKKDIEDIYNLRAAMSVDGELYHVDHIVPLQGANVCGLHVPWNLRIIPAEDNLSKAMIYNGDDSWPYETQVQMRRERWEKYGKNATFKNI